MYFGVGCGRVLGVHEQQHIDAVLFVAPVPAALVSEPKSIVRYLTKLGEPTDVPSRSTSRGPRYWKSTSCGARPGLNNQRTNDEPAWAWAGSTRFAHPCVLRAKLKRLTVKGSWHSCALMNDSSMKCWGHNE
jgi:hypothetical protein